jgi:P-type Ca2+ transporter type 2C
MTVLCHDNSSFDSVYYTKGSIDSILQLCTDYLYGQNEIRKMDVSVKDRVLLQSHDLSKQGLRCLAFAYGKTENALVFVGFVGMYDPPRPGISEAVSRLVSGGVKIVMITGDSGKYRLTVSSKSFIHKIQFNRGYGCINCKSAWVSNESSRSKCSRWR